MILTYWNCLLTNLTPLNLYWFELQTSQSKEPRGVPSCPCPRLWESLSRDQLFMVLINPTSNKHNTLWWTTTVTYGKKKIFQKSLVRFYHWKHLPLTAFYCYILWNDAEKIHCCQPSSGCNGSFWGSACDGIGRVWIPPHCTSQKSLFNVMKMFICRVSTSCCSYKKKVFWDFWWVQKTSPIDWPDWTIPPPTTAECPTAKTWARSSEQKRP